MDNKPQFQFQQLENYIALHKFLTGGDLKEIRLSESVYELYIQECQKHADILGLNLGFKDDTPMFSGVKIVKDNQIKVTKDG